MRLTLEMAAAMLPKSLCQFLLYDPSTDEVCAVGHLMRLTGVDTRDPGPLWHNHIAGVLSAFGLSEDEVFRLVEINNSAPAEFRVEAVRKELLRLSRRHDPKPVLETPPVLEPLHEFIEKWGVDRVETEVEAQEKEEALV